MKKTTYIIGKHFIILLLFMTPLLQAKGGNVAGSLVGGMAGGFIGSSIASSGNKTTVVRRGGVSYLDLERLKDAIRSDLMRINYRMSDNEDNIRKLKNLRSEVNYLQDKIDRFQKRLDVIEEQLSDGSKGRMKENFNSLKSEVSTLRRQFNDLNQRITEE